MKVSQETKEKTKINILESAVDLIITKGFKNASMREIAKNAGVSNPTIYNYFPTKEHLLYFFIEHKHKETMQVLHAIDDFHTYSLREQLQTLIETELERYLEDREFLQEISELVFHSSSLKVELLYNTNALFTEMVEDMIAIAVEAGEIEQLPFDDHVAKLFWDYFVLVVAYWLKDDSEMFENTTQFIDHSMGVIEVLLTSQLLQRLSELGTFFLKNHLLNSLKSFSDKKEEFKYLKRKLKGVLDG
jgi:AcrR family transcriptional regulator